MYIDKFFAESVHTMLVLPQVAQLSINLISWKIGSAAPL